MSHKEYKVPLNGHPVDLADGSVAGPGERVKLSDEDALSPHNASLLADGHLMPVSEKGEKVQQRAERKLDRETEGGES